MRKLFITVLMLCSMLIVIPIPIVEAIAKDPKSVSNWFKKLSSKKEKLTEFHFYFHDTISGSNQTAFPVAGSNITDSSPNLFGRVSVIDDPLTVGPEPDSEIVGRAQGIYASAAMIGDLAVLMTMNIVFTGGKYNGSTLSVLGRNPVFDTYREMTVIGGSGTFRLARGVATAKTVVFNLYVAVVEYHIIVIHY